MSLINTTQHAIVAEEEFTRLVTLSGSGRLEVFGPLMDDERRDVETHSRGQLAPGLSFQVG